jgi:hypothetical protein
MFINSSAYRQLVTMTFRRGKVEELRQGDVGSQTASLARRGDNQWGRGPPPETAEM